MSMKVGDKVRIKKSVKFVIGENLSRGVLRRWVRSGNQFVVLEAHTKFLIIGIPGNKGWRSLREVYEFSKVLKIKEENLELC